MLLYSKSCGCPGLVQRTLGQCQLRKVRLLFSFCYFIRNLLHVQDLSRGPWISIWAGLCLSGGQRTQPAHSRKVDWALNLVIWLRSSSWGHPVDVILLRSSCWGRPVEVILLSSSYWVLQNTLSRPVLIRTSCQDQPFKVILSSSQVILSR